LKRLADTQTDTTLVLDDPAAGNDVVELPKPDDEENAVEHALIPHEIFTRSWRSTVTNELSDVPLRFPETLLKMIGALTNCRVELEADGGTITARAENMQDVEKAILKLKTIDDWLVSWNVPAFSNIKADILVSTSNFAPLIRFLLCRRRA
jgi:hypothetical protein